VRFCAFHRHFSGFGFILLSNLIHARPPVPRRSITPAVKRFRFSNMRRYILFCLLVGTIALPSCVTATSTSWTATANTSRPLPTETPLTFTPDTTFESPASPPTSTSEIIPACTPADTTETPSEGLEKARNVLTSFFVLLNHREYERAAVLYGGEYQGLRDSNPLLDPQDHAALLKNACEINGLQCLRVKRIVDEKAVSLAEYHFTVEFMNQDGSLFVRGPCCGGNATDFPPESQFAYIVIRNCAGEFFVTELPVYVP